MCVIDLTGLDKAVVLAALYNASRPQGMGFLHYDPTPMTTEEAHNLLEGSTYFDYLKGRVMKIDLSGNTLAPGLYDRDNGDGAAVRAIASLRQSQDTASPEITAQHKTGRNVAAAQTMNHLHEESHIERTGGSAVLHLGLADVAEPLRAAVKKAVKP